MHDLTSSLVKKACATLVLSLLLGGGAGTAEAQKKGSCRENCPECNAQYKACYRAEVLPLIKGKPRSARNSGEYKAAIKDCKNRFRAACKALRAQSH